MEEIKLDLITKEMLDKSIIFEEFGTRTCVTDFTLLLGKSSVVFGVGTRYSSWITKSKGKKSSSILNVSEFASFIYGNSNINDENIGIRPIVKYSLIKDLVKVEDLVDDDLSTVLYGNYPSTTVDLELNNLLEEHYKNNELVKTGMRYEVPVSNYNYDKITLDTIFYDEYEYDNRKFIRFEADNYYTLNNLVKVEKGQILYIEVEPVRWIVDKNLDFAITENIIFSGIPFSKDKHYFGNFEKTNMYKFLNEILLKDIKPSKEYQKSVNIDEKIDSLIRISGNKKEIIDFLKNINDNNIKEEEVSYVRKK